MKTISKLLSIMFLVFFYSYIISCSGGGGSSTETVNFTANVENGDGAQIEVMSYNKDGTKQRDSKQDTISGNQYSTTLKVDKNGGYILVNITKDGYVDWSKRINFSQPQNITVNATLETVQSQAIIPVNNNTITVASNGKKVIKIALIKRSNGKKVIAAGNQIIAMDGTPEFTMEIPKDAIPSDVKALKVGLSSFDPIKDADKFPGDYIDENGNRLISLGFNFIDIKDAETGNPIFSEGQISKTQSQTYRITRWIGSGVCNNLQGDFCTGAADDSQICSNLTQDEINGYNVPFYRYNEITGTWELLGVGTIDINNDGIIDSNDAVNNSFDAVAVCIDNGGFNTIIVITNPNFRYCNLDYPVVVPPTELCIDKTFVDINNQPFTQVIAWLEDDDENQSFLYSAPEIVGQNGTVRLTTWNIEGDGDTQAKLYYQYTLTVGNESILITKEETVNLGTAPNCTQKTNIIDLTEKLCKVKGTVKYLDDNTYASNVSLFITDDNTFFRYTTTDENGNFEAIVPCEKDLYVYFANMYYYYEYEYEGIYEFNANGTVEDDEVSDEEQPANSSFRYIVDLGEIPIEKPKYTLYVYKEGNGTVTSNPSGINCGEDCYEEYEQGTQITLTATPDTGYLIDSWIGCDNISTDKTTCTVTMNSHRFVSVKFISETRYTLNVTVSGDGYVMSSPTGIHCDENGDMCSSEFDKNQTVTLTAYPYNGYQLSQWGGDCSQCGSNKTCEITMDSDKNCTATFEQAPPPSIDMTGVWEGSYQGNDGSAGQICVELNQDNSNLTGKLYIQGQGYAGDITGTVSGDNVTFGIAGGVQYQGTVNGNTANGTYDEDIDNQADGTWQITKTNKTSCGWVPEDVDGNLSEYLGIPAGIITEVSTITAIDDGNSSDDWYAVAVEYEDVNVTQNLFLQKLDGSVILHIVSGTNNSSAVAYSGNTSTYSGLTSHQFLTNTSYETNPIYDNCTYVDNYPTRVTVYKGTGDISLPQITLTSVDNISNTRTFEIPQQNITIYKYKIESSNCQ